MKIAGYSDEISVAPGGKVRFMVSSEHKSYRADIVRLIHGDENPKGPGFKEALVETSVSGEYAGRVQPLRIGSYATVKANPLLDVKKGVTLQAWIFPTTTQKGLQGIVTKWSATQGIGYGLFLDASGSLCLQVGSGKGQVEVFSSNTPLKAFEWASVAASYDLQTGAAVLVQTSQAHWAVENPPVAAQGTLAKDAMGQSEHGLLMAGFWEEEQGSGAPVVGGHFNGKIDSPRLYDRALGLAEIEALRQEEGGQKPEEGLVAAWDFAKDITSRKVTDASPNGLDGRTVNLPMRAVTGHNWSGRTFDFNIAPEEYGAIYFHDDDLDDARWEVDFEFTVPEGFKSGVYAARLQGGESEDHIPFFVRPPKGTATADILFLAPTNSYIAYGDEQTLNNPGSMELHGVKPGEYPKQPQEHYIVDNNLKSLYDRHADKTGVCYSSRRRPLVNMRPKYIMTALNHGKGAPHQFNADLHLLDWMETKGYAFDVVTDEDLHAEGKEILSLYRVVVTGTHPEYWTEQMMAGLEGYLVNGGRLMYMGGNGFYWVTSYDPELPGIIEIRRWRGTRSWEAANGEYYHSTTGELGGLWRYRGKAPQRMVGVGFTGQGYDHNRPYTRAPGSLDPRAAFIFEGIGDDEPIGDFESMVMNYGAGGFELDRHDFALGTPAHTLVLATSSGYSEDYQFCVEDVFIADSKQSATVHPLVKADMAYFETPKGGAVFSASTISWCGCLSYNHYDNNVSRITENVLKRFASKEPLQR